jgi:hypothetical protein
MTDYFKAGATNYEQDGLSWHKKEGVNPSILREHNVSQAMELCGIQGIEVVKAPIYMELPDGQKLQSKKFGLVLQNVPWTENGIQDLERQVSWYEPINNARYGEILDPLAETYEVGSVLHCGRLGEVLVVQFRLPDFMVDDRERELHQTFLTIGDNRATGKQTYNVGTIRVVCKNTYDASISGVRSMPNGQDAEMMLVFRTSLEQQAIKTRQKFIGDMNKLFTKPVNSEDVTKVANVLFPMPKRPGFLEMTEQARNEGYDFTAENEVAQFASEKERKVLRDYQAGMDRQEQYLNAFFTAHTRFNDEQPYAANTGYSVWNAATEVQRADSEIYGRTEQDVATFNLLFGNRQKALSEVYSLLTK